jgi:hypothetical protein
MKYDSYDGALLIVMLLNTAFWKGEMREGCGRDWSCENI